MREPVTADERSRPSVAVRGVAPLDASCAGPPLVCRWHARDSVASSDAGADRRWPRRCDPAAAAACRRDAREDSLCTSRRSRQEAECGASPTRVVGTDEHEILGAKVGGLQGVLLGVAPDLGHLFSEDGVSVGAPGAPCMLRSVAGAWLARRRARRGSHRGPLPSATGADEGGRQGRRSDGRRPLDGREGRRRDDRAPGRPRNLSFGRRRTAVVPGSSSQAALASRARRRRRGLCSRRRRASGSWRRARALASRRHGSGCAVSGTPVVPQARRRAPRKRHARVRT